ncbi:MAG TPA: TetR/AcrR family transcriptional regulator [Solirubrobacterales bacterium]|jgi:AcrR family transcriptional regulator|nr:TetR/AcrR family transcriptional regulator [Solirubrobacterales bacterium]
MSGAGSGTVEELTPRRLSRKEKQAQTRERLLEAAERVFLRRGLEGSSVEEITAEAGFSRGAFYSNFESKDQLFVELLQDRVYRGYRRVLDQIPDSGATPRERLRWGAARIRDVQARDQGRWLFRLWLECLAKAARDDEFRALAATFWNGNRAAMAAEGRSEYEELGRKPPLPTEQIATAMIALDIGLAVQHLVDPDAVPLDLYVPLYDLLFGPLVE